MKVSKQLAWIAVFLISSCSSQFTPEGDGEVDSTDGAGDVQADGESDLPDDSGDATDDLDAQDEGRRECSSPADCNDDNRCTIDICFTDGFCTYAFEDDGTDCDDDSFCNGADTCDTGVCVHAGNPCVDPDSCSEEDGWCACNDGNACTGPDHLNSDGECVGDNLDDLLCGPCDSTACRRCCGGSCVSVTERDLCGHCGFSCSGSESCVYSPTSACGWLWCCST